MFIFKLKFTEKEASFRPAFWFSRLLPKAVENGSSKQPTILKKQMIFFSCVLMTWDVDKKALLNCF